jgi:hypothetical protein
MAGDIRFNYLIDIVIANTSQNRAGVHMIRSAKLFRT